MATSAEHNKPTTETLIPAIFAFSRIKDLYNKIGPVSTSTGALHLYQLSRSSEIHMRPNRSPDFRLSDDKKFDSGNQPIYLIDVINVKNGNPDSVLHMDIGTSGLLRVRYGNLSLIPEKQVPYIPAAAYKHHRIEYSIATDKDVAAIREYMTVESFKNKVYPFVGWPERCVETRQFDTPPYPFDLSKKIE